MIKRIEQRNKGGKDKERLRERKVAQERCIRDGIEMSSKQWWAKLQLLRYKVT
jgi:hypothetical protein